MKIIPHFYLIIAPETFFRLSNAQTRSQSQDSKCIYLKYEAHGVDSANLLSKAGLSGSSAKVT